VGDSGWRGPDDRASRWFGVACATGATLNITVENEDPSPAEKRPSAPRSAQPWVSSGSTPGDATGVRLESLPGQGNDPEGRAQRPERWAGHGGRQFSIREGREDRIIG
jgi:hypothetical protein